MNAAAHVGIAICNGVFHVSVRRRNQAAASVSFPTDERGIDMLKRYVAAIQAPLRLAMVVSTAGIGLALALGEHPGCEVFLVAPAVADQSAALAGFAARPV